MLWEGLFSNRNEPSGFVVVDCLTEKVAKLNTHNWTSAPATGAPLASSTRPATMPWLWVMTQAFQPSAMTTSTAGTSTNRFSSQPLQCGRWISSSPMLMAKQSSLGRSRGQALDEFLLRQQEQQ